MPDQNIFCNTPWYELHVYWDGSLGICCQEDHKLYADHERYNIATTSISEWFNSMPVRAFRRSMFGTDRVSACRRCYTDEDSSGHSRRLKSNAKSVIFTRQAFHESWKQSPGHAHFVMSGQQDGYTPTLPIDLHIDLGNYCNLACKMCEPRASSTIATQQVKWGIQDSKRYVGTDWTRDERVWRDFLCQLLEIPNLKNIHLMGGETLLTPRMEQLVDWFIAHDRQDVCFSFVTNGTVYPHDLMTKLAGFTRVGIEVSIETMTDHNRYQRQGTDNALVIENIGRFRAWTHHPHISVALRPAPSILTVGHYHTLLDYALHNQLVVKSNLCFEPSFMRAELLPSSIKTLYRDRLDSWAAGIDWPDSDRTDFNASDPNNIILIVREQINMVRTLLDREAPRDSETELERLVRHCERWDKVYGLDAREFYPELQDIFQRYGYHV